MSEFKKLKPLYEAFGKDVISELPILDIGNKKGNGGYIDFIKADDMKYPVMKGIDMWNRPFIAIRVKCVQACRDTDENKISYAVGTFFQRYSDENFNWAYGTAYIYSTIYWDSRIQKYDYKCLSNRLKKLASGEKACFMGFSHENKECILDTMINNNASYIVID